VYTAVHGYFYKLNVLKTISEDISGLSGYA